jgi:phosphoserine phosphatase RsbU/P
MRMAVTTSPLVRGGDDSVEAPRGSGGLVLGIMPGAKYQNHAVMMQPGDRRVLYTDGLPEAFSPSDGACGEQRLIAEIQTHGDGPADA